MSLDHHRPRSLAVFCKVVDNFGDIGICWRLARQLQHEHGLSVTLWVDDLASFRRICPAVVDAHLQLVDGVAVRHWRDQEGTFSADDVADVVIEFFACEIPPGYVSAMAACATRPVWINLEGLSAEQWVEGCHKLTSPHPRLPLMKHFFFPGFGGNTGGLLREAGLLERCGAFQSDAAAVAAFLAPLGVTAAEMASFKVSLFCYPHAPVAHLFAVWRQAEAPITCLVPEGVAAAAVADFLGAPAIAGAAATHGALTLRVLPFVAQPDYDRLLWACELNFVRGEDSFVRAQWAGQPFIWHIYPQDENLHHKKLRAFLQRYAGGLDALAQWSLVWNGAADGTLDQHRWSALQAVLPAAAERARAWSAEMVAQGDFAANLLTFVTSLRASATEKQGIMPG